MNENGNNYEENAGFAPLKMDAEEAKLNRQMKNGMNWFIWIALLSMVNSILYFFNANISFLAGLGATQLINEFVDMASTRSIIIGVGLNLLLVWLYILIAQFSKKWNWVIVLGLIFYSIDSLLFLFVADWFSFLFHIVAIVGIIIGFRAKIKLLKLRANKISSETVTIDKE